METNIEKQYEDKLSDLLRRFVFLSRKFCDKYCVPDGLMDIMKFNLNGKEIPHHVLFSSKLSYDYDYYAFTKSTKTFNAIWLLLKDKSYNFNEDSLILVRSIFENHIMSRYFREHISIEVEREKVIKEFIDNPLSISLNYYIREGHIIKNMTGDRIGKIKGTSNYKISKDNDYYREFYEFLSGFAHCEFGRLDCYFDGALFYYDKNNIRLETILFAIFVFTKIFEGVVTVEGENFESPNEEKKYYDLVYDSLELQEKIFDYLINKYDGPLLDKNLMIIQLYLNKDDKIEINSKIREMLLKMKDSLSDNEIGSLIKKKDNESGKYIREYPI